MQAKTVVVAVGRPGDSATTEHAISITSPGDRILFVSAVKSNQQQAPPSAEEAFAKYLSMCARHNRRCDAKQVFFHSGGRTERLDVADALCIAAQVADASTLCLGFRGIGAASRTMFGSVSDQCSRTCPVSVAVVKQRTELHPP
jgi:nucleotide-binding universal stress UspA family protein